MQDKMYWKIASIDSHLQARIEDALEIATEKLLSLYPDGIVLPRDNTFFQRIDGKDYLITGMNEDYATTYKGANIDLQQLSQWECLELLRRMMFALEDSYLNKPTEED